MGKSIRKLLASLRKADEDYNLIAKGDKIVLGISGGKDSLALLKAMSLYSYFAKKEFSLYPVYLDLGFPPTDISKIASYAKECGTSLRIEDERFVYAALKANQKEGHHLPCSICSRMKKAAMKDIAIELGCNKIAFAHHYDDALETLFLNAVHGGKLSSFAPKMELDKGLYFIRPLIYAHEKDIISFVSEENVPVLESSCPANKHTDREKAKETIRALYEIYPESEKNLYNLFFDKEKPSLPYMSIEYKIGDSDYSLKPILKEESMHLSFVRGGEKEGEESYLIIEEGKVVGEISLYKMNAHKIAFHRLKGKKEAKLKALSKLIEMKKKRISPLTCLLLGEKENLAIEAGFAKKIDISDGKSRYMKRV